jgi:hypothetical protein
LTNRIESGEQVVAYTDQLQFTPFHLPFLLPDLHSPGERFSVTFVVAGEYPYLDERNDEDPAYFGTIVVIDDQPTGGPPPAAATVTLIDESFQPPALEVSVGATITWEGRSCNGRPTEGRGRGASIHGTEGTAIVDRSGYVIYDNQNNEIARRMRGETIDALDTRGGGSLTDLHITNFLDSVRGEGTPTAHIEGGHKSQLLCHLGNIAQRTSGSLFCDPSNGRILENEKALSFWDREYEPGWEPKV